jgi:hypothetical protein
MEYDYTTGGTKYFASTANTFTNQFARAPQSATRTGYNTFFVGYYNLAGYNSTPQENIVEVIYVNGIMSSTEITNLQNYLTCKYNL